MFFKIRINNLKRKIMPINVNGKLRIKGATTGGNGGGGGELEPTLSYEVSYGVLGTTLTQTQINNITGQSPTTPPNWRPIFDRCNGW